MTHARERLIPRARPSIRFSVRLSMRIVVVFSLAAIYPSRIHPHTPGKKDSRPAGAGRSDRGGIGRVLGNDETAAEHQLHVREAAGADARPRRSARLAAGANAAAPPGHTV